MWCYCTDDIVQVLGPHLSLADLLSLASTCRAVHATQGIRIDLAASNWQAEAVLALVSRRPGRFYVSDCDVSRCDQAKFNLLLALPGLQGLTVRSPGSPITSLAAAAGAPALRSLRMRERVVANDLDVTGLGGCPSLEHVSIRSRPGAQSSLRGMNALHACARLRALDLNGCGSDDVAAGLSSLARGSAAWALERCSLQASTGLEATHLTTFSSFQLLTSLDLSRNISLTSVAPLGRCARLEKLVLSGCTALQSVAGLEECPALHSLYLSACTRLRSKDLTPLMLCKALAILYLNRCTSIDDVSELVECPALKLLNVRCSGALVVPCREGLNVQFDSASAVRNPSPGTL